MWVPIVQFCLLCEIEDVFSCFFSFAFGVSHFLDSLRRWKQGDRQSTGRNDILCFVFCEANTVRRRQSSKHEETVETPHTYVTDTVARLISEPGGAFSDSPLMG